MVSPEENVALLIGYWTLFAKRLPKGTVEQGGGVVSLFANEPLAFLNLTVLDGPKDTAMLRQALATAAARAASCPHDSYLALPESFVPPDWQALASEAGWFPAFGVTAMDTETLLPPSGALPQLELRQVCDHQTATDLAVVNAHAYGIPPDLFACMFNLDLWPADSAGFVGYKDGKAVTAAAIFPVAGTAYAAFVATMPESQGRGYAEAALRHAIPKGKRITMHATDKGRPLYERMGFVASNRTVLLSRLPHPA